MKLGVESVYVAVGGNPLLGVELLNKLLLGVVSDYVAAAADLLSAERTGAISSGEYFRAFLTNNTRVLHSM